MSKLSKYLKEKLGEDYSLNLKSDSSVWAGPVKDGITQSLLNQYLSCSERFRLYTIEGLTASGGLDVTLEYGQMWHLCEEILAAGGKKKDWEKELLAYSKELCKIYKNQQYEVLKWYNVCKVQFPIYEKFWREEEDVKNRVPIYQEETFSVRYKLPSGRTVRLRGKLDSADRIKKDGIYLQENKTKGRIDEQRLQRNLTFDLQTMMYSIALETLLGKPVKGVRYNVIRRPLSGGAGSIRRKKARGSTPEESEEDYYNRLKEIIEESPETFFFRWKVIFNSTDVSRFKNEFFHPVLENVLDDYEWWSYCKENSTDAFDYTLRGKKFKHHSNRHFRFPYIFRPMLQGWSTDWDDYLKNGSTVGLEKLESLFTELG
jgi:hypothetical protein